MDGLPNSIAATPGTITAAPIAFQGNATHGGVTVTQAIARPVQMPMAVSSQAVSAPVSAIPTVCSVSHKYIIAIKNTLAHHP